MPPTDDPFAHHPVLRERISDPLTSYFRNFEPASIDPLALAAGRAADWRLPDEQVEADRRAFLEQHGPGDLWVFGYGSLMWDPAFLFAEVRKGRVSGYQRRFCLRDTMARGSGKAPGLMAALDLGEGCEGLVFRIAAGQVAEETGYVWRRELFTPAYLPVMVKVSTDFGMVDALAVVANHASEVIHIDLTLAEQAQYIATGQGFLGTSREYLTKIAAQLVALGIEDKELTELLAAVRRLAKED